MLTTFFQPKWQWKLESILWFTTIMNFGQNFSGMAMKILKIVTNTEVYYRIKDLSITR